MLDRENNKIYIRYRKTRLTGNIAIIISVGIFCIKTIKEYSEKQYEYEVLNILFKDKFTIVFFTIIFIISFIIYILNVLFSRDINYYIDLNKKKLILIRGKKPFKNEVTVDFDHIKEIVITKTKYEIGYKYSIDIYDNQLNAYECYHDMDYKTIQDIAYEIGAIFKKDIVDKTDTDYYEGFIKRLI